MRPTNGHQDRCITDSRASSNRLRSTAAERASITSRIRGNRARPTALRMIGVISRKTRPAASRIAGGPATASIERTPYRRTTEAPITRMADRPIGVSGRCKPWARLKQK
jgi:hypothetical protein